MNDFAADNFNSLHLKYFYKKWHVFSENLQNFNCISSNLSELGTPELPVKFKEFVKPLVFDIQSIQCCIPCVYHHATMEL